VCVGRCPSGKAGRQAGRWLGVSVGVSVGDWKQNPVLTPTPRSSGELVLERHVSQYGARARGWPEAALESLRRRHEWLLGAISCCVCTVPREVFLPLGPRSRRLLFPGEGMGKGMGEGMGEGEGVGEAGGGGNGSRVAAALSEVCHEGGLWVPGMEQAAGSCAVGGAVRGVPYVKASMARRGWGVMGITESRDSRRRSLTMSLRMRGYEHRGLEGD
jgi:hypothetical protein